MSFLSFALRQSATRARVQSQQQCVNWWSISCQLHKTQVTLAYLRDSLTDANDGGLRIRQELEGAKQDCAYLREKLEKLEEQRRLEQSEHHESLDQIRADAAKREAELVQQQQQTMHEVLGTMQGEVDKMAQQAIAKESAWKSVLESSDNHALALEAAMQGVLNSAQGALAQAAAEQAESNLEHLKQQEEYNRKVKAARLSLSKLDLDLSFEETSVKRGGMPIAIRNWRQKALKLKGQILMHASASAIAAGASRSVEARVAEAMGELRKKLLDTQIEAASNEAALKREIAQLQVALQGERARHLQREETFEKKEVESLRTNIALRDEHVSNKSSRWSRRSEQMSHRRDVAAKQVADRIALLKSPPSAPITKGGSTLRRKSLPKQKGT